MSNSKSSVRQETLVIIGSGPAGWSAATYAARAQLKPLVFEGAITEKNRMSGTLPLGQLALTSEVENYAGFPHGNLGEFLDSALPAERRQMMAPHAGEGVTGPELMELMRQQAVNMGTRIITDDILKVDFSQRPFRLYPSEGGVVEAQCVIVATGASANWLGLPSEEKYKNRGVSACAVCDGALPRFRNQPIVVVGGGDSAVEEATYLAKFAS
ncbi:MAG: FAD-dependent oxidoreductase, partial [Planctomycetota bacterium]